MQSDATDEAYRYLDNAPEIGRSHKDSAIYLAACAALCIRNQEVAHSGSGPYERIASMRLPSAVRSGKGALRKKFDRLETKLEQQSTRQQAGLQPAVNPAAHQEWTKLAKKAIK